MPTKRHPDDLRNTRRYQLLRLVVLEEEPTCWLRFTGCTTYSTTADHILTVTECIRLGRPDLIVDRDNLRGACLSCNTSRHDRTIEEIQHLMGAADHQPMRVFD